MIHSIEYGVPAALRAAPRPDGVRPPFRPTPTILLRPRLRRSLRRSVRTSCQAVALDGFRLLGERVLDLSTRGMLVTCDQPVDLGEEVVVSFRAPNGGPWLDAEAEVARLVEGWRPSDPGYCAGLRFTHFDGLSRGELLVRLAGLPPPVPRRPLRPDYAATVRRIWSS